MDKKNTRIAIDVPKDMHKALKLVAVKKELSIRQIILILLNEYLEAQDDC